MKKQTAMLALALLLGLGGVTLSTVSKAKAADTSCPTASCNGGNLKCCSNSNGSTWYKS